MNEWTNERKNEQNRFYLKKVTYEDLHNTIHMEKNHSFL